MSMDNLGRVAFVYRGDFVPRKEYCRYDIVAAHGNLYHCMGLEMYAYNKIDVDETGNVIGLDADYWELFLKGTGGYALKAGEGIEVAKDDSGNWTIKNITAVVGGNNIDVKTAASGNTVTYKVTGLHQPITSSTLKIREYTVLDDKTKAKADGYEIDWPLGKTEGIDVRQGSDGKWNFTAKTSQPTPAAWEKWWIKYPWDLPEEIIPMPLYVSAAGMNVVGYCCDQDSAGGNLGYVTDGGYSFARYSTKGDSSGAASDIHPVIVVNPTRQYATIRRDPDNKNNLWIGTSGAKTPIYSYDYFTKDEADEYMSKATHEVHVGSLSGSVETLSGDVQAYINDTTGMYLIYQEYKDEICAADQRTCWECVSASALSTGRCNWDLSSSGSKLYYKLHGPDSRLIGYIKWGSDFPPKWGGKLVRQLHWHNYYIDDTYKYTDWYQPGTSENKNKVYAYTVSADGKYSYSSEDKNLEKDKWYGILLPPDASVPHLLEITDENGDILQEHRSAFESASSPRSCIKSGDTYRFTVTVQGSDISWSCGSEDFKEHFKTKTNASGEIIEVSLKNKAALISAFGRECLYAPPTDVCVDCDTELKYKKIYNTTNPICIPEFSGCTFIKNT